MFEGGASRPRRCYGGRRFCTKIPQGLRARHLGKVTLTAPQPIIRMFALLTCTGAP